MTQELVVDKDSEFFIAIAKQGLHSFLMLGVMHDGKPNLLARVGKGHVIDSCSDMSCALPAKELFYHSDATIIGERIRGEFALDSKISYQAYSITVDQYHEFLALIAIIQRDQRHLYQDKRVVDIKFNDMSCEEQGAYKLHKEGIWAYVLHGEQDDSFVFVYKALADCDFKPVLTAEREVIMKGARELSISNTCRTTARDMLENILGKGAAISSIFVSELDYKVTLIQKQPCADSFYILPPPPASYPVSAVLKNVLKKLYRQLRQLPKDLSSNELTRRKFELFKSLYLDLAGKSKQSLEELISQIDKYCKPNKKLIDSYRKAGVCSFFGLDTNSRKTLGEAKEILQQGGIKIE